MDTPALVFDLETDGLLDTVTKVHCLNIIDRATGKRLRFNGGVYGSGDKARRDGTIEEGVELLRKADVIAGQNVIAYDIPVLDKLFGFKPTGKVFDTRTASRVIWPNLADIDFAAIRAGKRPVDFQSKGYVGSNKLAAWGFRLGEYKGDFNPKDYGYTWATCPFMLEMSDYCEQDCEVTLKWLEFIESRNYSQECLDLEMRVATIIAAQERHGFCFDVPAAEKLAASLMAERAELESALTSLFPPWKAKDGKPFVPKRDNARFGYTAGVPVQKYKTVVFNPGSRDHIADRLMTVHGWKPKVFTPTGKPQIDETILGALPYNEAKELTRYMLLVKRLGQLAEGSKAWLKKVKADGRIHGSVNTNGAVTGRMTHSDPNVAQVDKWEPMRALWTVPKNYVLVGCDAEGLELRSMGHYMAQWDGGEYAEAVVNGKKENGTDVHTVNQKAIGLNKRDSAKTFIYALIYGAGDFKLGTIVRDDYTDEQRAKFKVRKDSKTSLAALGKARRARLMKALPALGKLTAAVKKRAKLRGYLKGLDGRKLHVRAEHAALNTLLQSAGAVAMKKALVLFADAVEADPKLRGKVHPVANIHDEFQIEVPPNLAQIVGKLAADSITKAGEHFGFRCPLSGAFDVGKNWSETH